MYKSVWSSHFMFASKLSLILPICLHWGKLLWIRMSAKELNNKYTYESELSEGIKGGKWEERERGLESRAQRREGEDKRKERRKQKYLPLRRGLWRTLYQAAHREQRQIYACLHLHAHSSATQTLISKLISTYLIPQLSFGAIFSSCQPLSVYTPSCFSLQGKVIERWRCQMKWA